jgi:integrase
MFGQRGVEVLAIVQTDTIRVAFAWRAYKMKPLPLSQIDSFESRIERAWCLRKLSWAKRRDACVIGLGLCGLRWEEVSRVRRDDLDRVDGGLMVRTAKNGPKRRVPVGLSLTAGLVRVWMDLPPDGASVRSGWAFYTQTGQALSYESVLRRTRQWTRAHFGQAYTFHCLRHTAAIRMYLATRDVVAVQRLLGHRSLRWTSVYLEELEVCRTEGLPAFAVSKPAGLRVFDPDGMGQRAG